MQRGRASLKDWSGAPCQDVGGSTTYTSCTIAKYDESSQLLDLFFGDCIVRFKLLPAFLMLVASALTAQADTRCWTAKQGDLIAVSSEQAREASKGAVVLHFGDAFNDFLRDELVQATYDLGYRFCAFLGGPEGEVSLFIDGEEGSRDFAESDASEYVLTVLERNAAEFRVAEGCPNELEVLSDEQAVELSSDRIVVHFGAQFSEFTRYVIARALKNNSYDFCSVQGGPDSGMNLFIDGQQGKRPFSPDEAVQYLLPVLDQNAQEFQRGSNDG